MNILVTGAQGQLGRELYKRHQDLLNEGHTLYFTDQTELDITQYEGLAQYLDQHPVEVIINCAAFTDVDQAESNQESAFLINDTATGHLARLAGERHIRLIHISTDYVFDGRSHKPYVETDNPAPQGIYGQSKLAGEQKVLHHQAGMIIRTAWLYSPYGKNFVKTIARLVREKDQLQVIYDQVGSPTYAGDLARAIVHILNTTPDPSVLQGIYHFSNEGVCSWYDFAQEIARIQQTSCDIQPIESKDWPTPAPRPHYSVFNKSKIKNHFHLQIPYWRDSLYQMLKNNNG